MNMAEKPVLLTGNHAVAWAARLARPQVVPVYPITPQTPVLELLTDFQAEGHFDAEIITPESEHSVMSACIPASLAGARVFTATASQGLLLMHELLHYAAGATALWPRPGPSGPTRPTAWRSATPAGSSSTSKAHRRRWTPSFRPSASPSKCCCR
jgi:Pyruvate flavodoxin/ferredoxin oxidoreductase, thiamine diP-bdg